MPQNQPEGTLNGLIGRDRQAEEYFASLPALVKETLMMGHQNICTMDELRQCAENMTRGE